VIGGGKIVISAQAPVAGTFRFVAKRVHGTSEYGHGAIATTAGTPVTLVVTPSARSMRMLARHRSLRLRITIRFTSVLGTTLKSSVIPMTVMRTAPHLSGRRTRP
jgi:hypothetical protein